MKRFNVTGLCVPTEDYMVDISDKVEKIAELVHRRCYFTINRARQYGKTTTLNCLRDALKNEYIVIFTSFEGLEDECFESSETFCRALVSLIVKALRYSTATQGYIDQWKNQDINGFQSLSEHISNMCVDQKVVLIIDEVDKSSNNRVFLHFLGMLREKFLARKAGMDSTFHSVILAGVYDIKNIKLKMINDGVYTLASGEGQLQNSPWNIAESFNVDMSFSPDDISTMLIEYEHDHNTAMDMKAIASEIFYYTNGYPYLVSKICKIISENLNDNWTPSGIRKSVEIILNEKNTLFDDLIKNLEGNNSLYNLIYDILIVGKKITFSYSNPIIDLCAIYGILVDDGNFSRISNRIYEIFLCNYFISKDTTNPKNNLKIGMVSGINSISHNDIIVNNRFNMELCLIKFADHYKEIYNDTDLSFLERQSRLLFLTYLKPLINGHGFYHIESQFTDQRRMDIVLDYGIEQFIIELKIWHGDKYKQDAYNQLLGYLSTKNL